MSDRTIEAAPCAVPACDKAPAGAKGRRTRERLLQAALVVFGREGFTSTRVTDIVQEAGVAHGSFYTYFDSKDEVFREATRSVVDEIHRTLEETSARVAASDPSAAEIIRAGNTLILSTVERHSAMLAQIEQLAATDEEFRRIRLDLRHHLSSRVESAILHLIRTGTASIGGMSPSGLARMLTGLSEGFAYAQFVLKDEVEDDAVETLTTVWLRALGIQQGTNYAMPWQE